MHTPFLRLILTGTTALAPALALAKPPAVVTDIPAVQALAQQVMGDLGQPGVLMDQGGDPHHYQLRPSQAASLQDADLLVWIGPELTPWLTRSADSLGPDRSLPLLAQSGTHLRSYAGNGDEDHDHAEGDGHDHDHDGTDPHAWLDPQNGVTWLNALAGALAQRDPENAATYQANAAKGVAQIEALDATLKAELAPVQGKPFVVFHDAYGYFTAHFGLPPAVAVSLGDASTPSAARLSQIRAQIHDSGAVCAFPERNHDARLLEAVTEGSNLRPGAALDPEGTAAERGAGLYAAILQGLATTLVDCLSQG
ncbi:zinc ABC transporter substrate-binding protein [Paracoccus limosus]|uniref:High-affinity zinc uptake system protein ZnuA n=2 Tax=Paracoccus limosus TaxID=913252 RepID=A0A844H5U4_9RHOB|nr:zinc ABC transporter substrate-binding protein [Paracoccus limosus]MTH34591.1 zinc ABC transporter substrate-binding protein [Paracoccus limosus]